MDEPSDPAEERYNLRELAEAARVSPRTVRSWMQAGLLDKASGAGPGSHYGAEHRLRAQFIRACQDAAGGRLTLEALRGIVDSTPEDRMRRIARGEEDVQAIEAHASRASGRPVGRPAPPTSLARVAESDTAASGSFAPAGRPRPTPPRAEPRPPSTTTFHVLDDLDLHLHSDDPARIAWAARLARRIRAWSEEEEA